MQHVENLLVVVVPPQLADPVEQAEEHAQIVFGPRLTLAQAVFVAPAPRDERSRRAPPRPPSTGPGWMPACDVPVPCPLSNRNELLRCPCSPVQQPC